MTGDDELARLRDRLAHLRLRALAFELRHQPVPVDILNMIVEAEHTLEALASRKAAR